MNLSLLIGTDRFTYFVSSKNNILELSVYELNESNDVLSIILKILKEAKININIFESINISVLKTDEKKENTTIMENIAHYFKNNFPLVHVKDCFDTMIQAYKQKYTHKSSVFSYWQSGKIYFWALTYGAVENLKNIKFRTAEDVLYYVLQFYKNNNLDTLEDTLCISGSLTEDSTIYRLLKNYISQIEFVKNPTDIQLKSTAEIPEHFFFDILSASL